MNAGELLGLLHDAGVRFATGVPDSLLTGLTDMLGRHPGIRHMVAASEGAAVALAAGHCLGTGRRPLVYMQNSGLANALNPLLSMCHPRVYDLPMLLVVGWRGEPGQPDEPQHLPTGAITTSLLDQLEIPWFVLEREPASGAERLRVWLAQAGGRSCALVVPRNAIIAARDPGPGAGSGTMDRTAALARILAAIPDEDAVFGGIGYVGRELLHARLQQQQTGAPDFLCVGAMGHASQFALGFALARPERRVWCLDGDGSFTMHMGSCNLVSRLPGTRFVHVLFDNGVHASVGGSEVCGRGTDYGSIARAAGYAQVVRVEDEGGMGDALRLVRQGGGPAFLWVLVSAKSKDGLPRPGDDLIRLRDRFRELVP